jgi:hypothetical protein
VAAMDRRFETYEQFWRFYALEHSSRTNRALHFAGTTLALGAVAAAVSIAPWWLAAAPAAGYAFAWIGHFVFEKNRPATFAYPLWSLRADFRMYRYIWLGRMAGEVRRAQECLAAQRR